jgi:hypothetical protein
LIRTPPNLRSAAIGAMRRRLPARLTRNRQARRSCGRARFAWVSIGVAYGLADHPAKQCVWDSSASLCCR